MTLDTLASLDTLVTIPLEELLEAIQNVAAKYHTRFDLEYIPGYVAHYRSHRRGWKAVIGSLESTQEPGVTCVTRRAETMRDAVHLVVGSLMYSLPDEPLLARFRIYEANDGTLSTP